MIFKDFYPFFLQKPLLVHKYTEKLTYSTYSLVSTQTFLPGKPYSVLDLNG